MEDMELLLKMRKKFWDNKFLTNTISKNKANTKKICLKIPRDSKKRVGRLSEGGKNASICDNAIQSEVLGSVESDQSSV